MLYHLLAYAGEAGVLGQVGDVAVHVAVDFDMFYHRGAVGLEPAIEVVEVLDAAYATGRGIEQLGGYGLGQRIVALFLVAGHQVIAFFGNHSVQLGNFVRAVLQVGVHSDDHVALGGGEARVQCRRFAVIAAEGDAAYMLGIGLAQTRDDLP